MSKVKICVNIDDADLRRYRVEAKRRGTTVEQLIEGMVEGLIREMREEQDLGTDHPITPR